MLPSSAIQILESTPSRLHIYCPPNYGMAFGWFIVSMAAALLLVWTRHRAGKAVGWWWVVPIFFGSLGVFLMSTFGHVTLSSKDGSFHLNERYLFLIHRDHSYPLKDLQQAVVETNEGGTHLLNFVFGTGEEVPLGPGFMNRSGYYQAANAVNSFLAVASSSGGAEPNSGSDEPEELKQMEEKTRKDAEKYGMADKPSETKPKSKPDSGKQ